MVLGSLLLFDNISMVNFMVLQTVMGSFHIFSIGESEVGATSFKIPAKVSHNHMCFLSFINFKVLIEVLEVSFESIQIKVSILRFEDSSN